MGARSAHQPPSSPGPSVRIDALSTVIVLLADLGLAVWLYRIWRDYHRT